MHTNNRSTTNMPHLQALEVQPDLQLPPLRPKPPDPKRPSAEPRIRPSSTGLSSRLASTDARERRLAAKPRTVDQRFFLLEGLRVAWTQQHAA